MWVTRGHPHKGEYLSPCRSTRRCNFPTRGGQRIGGARRDAGKRSPLTAGSWLQSYEFLTLGPRAIRHGRGEEKPKKTKQLELLQGNGVAEAATRSDRGDLAPRCSPGAVAKSMRGLFPADFLI